MEEFLNSSYSRNIFRNQDEVLRTAEEADFLGYLLDKGAYHLIDKIFVYEYSSRVRLLRFYNRVIAPRHSVPKINF